MDNIKEVIVRIDGQEWQDALDRAFEKANKKAKIDGFRPGKAPKEVFFKKYGKESLFLDAGDLVLEKAYTKVIEENKDLVIIAKPDVQLKSVDEMGIELLFILTLSPQVKLGNYKELNVEKEVLEVTEEEINQTIDEMRGKFAENVIKEGKVADGDIVVINFEGFKDGIPFDDGKGENYNLKIGSGTFIPGFEEQIIGMQKDEERDIKVTFPDEYHVEDLKGKEAIFKIKVNEIKETKIPELDDDFFEDLGIEGVDSPERLREHIKEALTSIKETEIENRYIDNLISEALKETEVALPNSMVQDEISRMISLYEENLKKQGLSLEQLYKLTNSNEEALQQQFRKEAERKVKTRLMLEEIAKVEKIEISDERAEEEALKLAEKHGMDKETCVKSLGGMDMIKYELMLRGAVDVLKGE